MVFILLMVLCFSYCSLADVASLKQEALHLKAISS